MEIRRLTPSDAAQFRRLRLEALKGDPTAFGSSYSEQVRQPLTLFEEKLKKSASNWMFGSFDHGKLIATLRLTREELKKERHKASIYGVFTAPAHRRRGVARALLQMAIDRAKKWKLRQVRLSVVASNVAAVRLYQSEGFSKYGEEQDSLFVAGKFYSEYLLAKKIANS
jgi:ribosomal protein S18 acetylase RimI-like enzyme